MKTLNEIKKEIEANQEVKRANDAERKKADNAFITAHKAHDRDAAGLASLEIEKLQKNAERIPCDADILHFLNNSSRAGKVLHAYPCGTWAEAQKLAKEWNNENRH